MREAVARLAIEYPVLIDSELELWQDYENEGWPARYLFDGRAACSSTTSARAATADRARDPGAPGHRARAACAVRPRTSQAPLLLAQTRRPGRAPTAGPTRRAACGRCCEGSGTVRVNGGPQAGGSAVEVTHTGAYALIEHERHTAGVLELQLGAGVRCLATCFTPGVAESRRPADRRGELRVAPVGEQALQRGGPVSSTSTQPPGQ